MRHALSAIMFAVLLNVAGHAGATEPPLGLVAEEFMVDADTPGVRLYVRNKHPVDMTQVPAKHVLLYVHGATQPSEATFDLPLDGMSWMDYIASQGWDVYLMDARGYGGSTRSPEFAQEDASQAPPVSTDMKVRDASSVIDFIRNRRGVSKVSLLGWSWGTIVTAAYAAEHPDKVSRLILYAPVWCEVSCTFDPRLSEATPAPGTNDLTLQPMIQSPMDAARKRLQSGVPQERRNELLSEDSFAAWSGAVLATDPIGAKKKPPVMRVPPGVSQDTQKYWDSGKSYYDPKAIVAPTLVVVAEWDGLTPPSGAHALHEALTNSADRHFVELKEGSHVIMLEKNRMSLFETVQKFLAAPSTPN